MHPYRNAAHKNDPKWLGGVKGYVEEPKVASADTKVTLRYHGGEPKVTAKASYAAPKGGK